MTNNELNERLARIEEELGIDPEIEKMREDCKLISKSITVKDIERRGQHIRAFFDVEGELSKYEINMIDEKCDSYSININKKELLMVRYLE